MLYSENRRAETVCLFSRRTEQVCDRRLRAGDNRRDEDRTSVRGSNYDRRPVMGKRIAVVGVGAVGGYTGAHMVRAGEDVTFIDMWPAHVDEMDKNGLGITHHEGEEPFTVKVRALHLTEAQHLAKEAPIDIAFVCMKSYDTQWAATLIRQYLAPSGYVVSLQNCMNEATIAEVVGWGRTLGCIASNISVHLHA